MIDVHSSEILLRLWPKAADPDGFCAGLIVPAFARENRTSLRLRRMTSLTGLRHLTTLRALHIDRGKEITDLTEVGELTRLTDLDLNGCAGIEDLTPIGRLTELTRLDLHRCRAVSDIAPLLTLGRLRELDLSMTKVRSADGFGTAFPALETLPPRGCRSSKDASRLSGLTRLTHLDLGWTGIRDLTGLRDVPAVTHLDLRGRGHLRDLTGIDALPALTGLTLDDCPRVADIPAGPVVDLNLKGVDRRDLSPLAGHRNLRGLRLWMPELKDIGTLSGLPGPTDVHLLECRALEDVSPLLDLPSLATATLPHSMAWEAYYGRPVPVHTALTERGVAVSGV
ncbi:leucine-rich repeat domain-containing protein [Streptomyces rapamycinicus]|uniref:Leucine-rich repeat domain-containing protein n=2 Tax=Streptomyces rapamycinicus TaxID=1226757 RepID=A0A0A0NHU2_STRRN|nr:leucine-rich repeat domain-containing protein [Streptomyces rapamycinicus]AGP53940.1 hypothetical protein M271_11705 [Streptomyces rapamycinicus NRRL 5491]MBB4781430.1 hypothetical protein [Streptomyces rapamycinicus]RLV73925.1 hypothetical protein D3C57_131905 [Streptomyces rapamycinicus NRRL 5491]UTO62050.1 leucine-rich repeat domain-containing protein [Streptomyces rapamycinicus]UTP30002.1 leucine-rich repeat domain-containing protein [Streptomyces rapamycinicus NRRL 5491]